MDPAVFEWFFEEEELMSKDEEGAWSLTKVLFLVLGFWSSVLANISYSVTTLEGFEFMTQALE